MEEPSGVVQLPSEAREERPTASSLLEAIALLDDPDEPDEQRRRDNCASAMDSIVSASSRDIDQLRSEWIECDGMIYGDQFGSVDLARGVWAPRLPALSEKVTRIAVNQMHPLLQTAASMHCRDRLNFRASAVKSTVSDLQKAQAADAIWAHYFDRCEVEARRREQVEGCLALGTWFVHPFWDPDAGKFIPRAAVTQEAGLDETGAFRPPDFTTVWDREGDLVLETLSPYQVTWDQSATLSRPGMWCSIDEEVPLAAILECGSIPQEIRDELRAERSTGKDGLEFQERRQALTPRGRQDGEPLIDRFHQGEKLIRRRIYVAATQSHPRGLEMIVAQGRMLYLGDNPKYAPESDEGLDLEHPAWPFPVFVFRDYTVGGAFYGQGDGIRMIPAQKALNGSLSKRLTIVKKVAHATLVQPRGVAPRKTDEVDQILEVPQDLPQGSIYYLNSPAFPQEIAQVERDAVQYMRDQIGIGDASLGEAPTKDSPAAAIKALQQADLGRRQMIQNAWIDGWYDVAKYMLEILRRNVTEPRKLKIVGPNKRLSIRHFEGADLEGVDLAIANDMVRPRDPAGLTVWMRSLIDMKLVDPADPIERAEMREAVGLGGSFARFEEMLGSDRERQRVEIDALYRGEQPTIEFWEKDQDHLAVLFGEMNTQQWHDACDPLPTDSPEVSQQKATVRGCFVLHAEQHLWARDRKLGQAAAAAAMPTVPGQYSAQLTGVPVPGLPGSMAPAAPGAAPPGAGAPGAMGAGRGAPAPEAIAA